MLPLIVFNSIIIYATFISYDLQILAEEINLTPQGRLTFQISLLVCVGLIWIYSTSRILFNYFKTGKPISFN